MRTVLLLLLFSCLALLAFNARAQQVNRCTNAHGQTVYGDKPCDVMGARARLLPARPAGGSGLYRDSCARRLSELVGQIHSAAQAQDANRLSSIYLWNGLSNTAATQVMDRLQEIVERPLLDIAPVFPEVAAYEPAPTEPFTYADGSPVDTTQSDTAPRPPIAAVAARRPVALRLEQTLPRSSTPTRTVLRLRRQYNCFWITL